RVPARSSAAEPVLDRPDSLQRYTDDPCSVLLTSRRWPTEGSSTTCEYLTHWTSHRDLLAAERYLTHLDGHLAVAIDDLTMNRPTGSRDGERGLANEAPVPEVTGKDAEAVPALLRFCPVRIRIRTRNSFHSGFGCRTRMPSDPIPKWRSQIIR